MKRFGLYVLLMVTCAMNAQTVNLIRDPELDKGNFAEFRFDYNPGTLKARIITEDQTGNKCLRLENVKHRINPKTGKKESFIVCWIGKDGEGPGFKAEPDTVYEFQFECKGNFIPRINYSEWNGMNFWKNLKTRKADVTVKPVVSNEWHVVKGTFKTSSTAQRAALCLEMSGQERWKTLVPVGAYIMIDKIRIEKKKSLLPSAGSAPNKE